MILDHQPEQKPSFLGGFSVVSARKGTGFIKSAEEPVFGAVSFELSGALHPIVTTARRDVTAGDVSETRVFGTITRSGKRRAQSITCDTVQCSHAPANRPSCRRAPPEWRCASW